MESGVKSIVVTYDEKRFRFSTGAIETLDTDGERKIKLKELFDVFSKNRTYIRLLDASSPKCAIVLLILSLIFSIVFLALAINDQTQKDSRAPRDRLLLETNFNLEATRHISNAISSIFSPNNKISVDDQSSSGTLINSLLSAAPVLSGVTDYSWRQNKNAAYWIVFALCLMILLFTSLLLISHQVRQRRLYHALEKYELDTIAEYMPFFKDTFMIKRMHRKKKIFKFFNCLFSFRFGYEVKVLDDPRADAVINMRPRNNDYHVGSDTDLNITGDLDNRQHKSHVYSYRDTEAYHINKEI